MSFKSNVGKPWVEPTAEQCEMSETHHPDCECASCKLHLDVQCLEPYVGTVPECDDIRVCSACAVQAEREDFDVTYRPGVRFVVVHPEMGVYLGSAMGMGFWSKLDPVGQDSAITFVNRMQAEQVMRAWDDGRPGDVVIWPMIPDRPGLARERYASIAACVAAGLEAWDPQASPPTR